MGEHLQGGTPQQDWSKLYEQNQNQTMQKGQGLILATYLSIYQSWIYTYDCVCTKYWWLQYTSTTIAYFTPPSKPSQSGIWHNCSLDIGRWLTKTQRGKEHALLQNWYASGSTLSIPKMGRGCEQPGVLWYWLTAMCLCMLTSFSVPGVHVRVYSIPNLKPPHRSLLKPWLYWCKPKLRVPCET